MIVSPRGERIVMVRQVDHQAQCRLMAEAWGNDEFTRLPGWTSLVNAAAWHDEGWRAWEDAPGVDPDGTPTNFIGLDRRVHVDVYRRGIAFALELDARAGRLVSMHGRGLYEARLGLDGDPPPRAGMIPEVRRFLAEQDAIAGRHDGDDGHWDAYRLLQAWDLLSLYATWRALPSGADGELLAVPREPGDPGVTVRLRPGGPETIVLEPYPFAVAPLELPVIARDIPNRPYAGVADLTRELGTAPARWLPLVARPG